MRVVWSALSSSRSVRKPVSTVLALLLVDGVGPPAVVVGADAEGCHRAADLGQHNVVQPGDAFALVDEFGRLFVRLLVAVVIRQREPVDLAVEVEHRHVEPLQEGAPLALGDGDRHAVSSPRIDRRTYSRSSSLTGSFM